ncbi:MAG: hypothetical protein BWX80_04118 [Candidatus Hydrogenedentes bacterium ADurb.Bin101]|nr:MAG: hypothetical protein BWX80_04118 [Candidatus Hydrogenedentes bacterium ADurb.Bin101]
MHPVEQVARNTQGIGRPVARGFKNAAEHFPLRPAQFVACYAVHPQRSKGTAQV